MIKVENIHKHFERPILRGIDLEVREKEFLCLVGESGSGKTTLLKIIAGLEKPNQGSVLIAGKKLSDINFDAGMVFQSAALLPWMTVWENVIFPFTITKSAYNQTEIEEIISEVGLTQFASKYPRDLSGGQHQRVGIARALALKRKILLLDEPFSALDIKTATELRRDLLRLWQANGLTVVMVSHLVEEAVELADRIIVLKNGLVLSRLNIDSPRPRELENIETLRLIDRIKNIIEN